MRSQLRVAAVQLTSNQEVAENLSRCKDWCERAADDGADLVALPENFGFLGRDRDKLPHAQTVDDGPFLDPLRAVAQAKKIYILAGSIPELGPDSDHTYNTTVLLGPDGANRAVYRKIHLFDIDIPGGPQFKESASVAPGTDLVVADVHGWALGLTVCYDLRFPEMYRKLLQQGARIFAVPAAFTLQTGKDHWDLLLRARAVENQCYVVAPGQFGVHGAGRVSWGKTQVIDPWGVPLAMAPEREGMAMATLSQEDQDTIRKQLPCLEHHRLLT